MDEQGLRGLIADVKAGKLSRRSFINQMIAYGLTAPLATQMLVYSGAAHAQAKPSPYKPTKRGGGGPLKTLWWQGPTLLNPHFAVGTKDQDACRIFYEPLAAWDPDGALYPVLAAEIPDLENNGLAKDGKSVTWKLRQGVKWHDGKPFTAEDVVFNWEYAKDPATAATTIGSYKDVKVEKVDDHTVRVLFDKPTPFWADAFVGVRGMIMPKHLFAEYSGGKSRDAPANLKPVGTGPYKFVEFKPGDMVRGEINNDYYLPNRPHFDTIEMKGGGDAISAARAVLQTGEYDYSWNLQVEDEILQRLEKGGKGRVVFADGTAMEHIQLNSTDPWKEVDGERSHAKTPHPILSDMAVRRALNLLVDRASVEKHIYGRTGIATGNFVNNPARFVSKNTSWEFNVEKANQLLDQAGWKRGADGVRAKDGKRLKLLLQTSINPLRQKEQAIIKQGAGKAGIEMELKTVVASVFFGSDEANPDNLGHFTADLQMYAWQFDVDPLPSMRVFPSWEVASKENKFSGRNTTRWRNEEFDRLYKTAETEMDPVKRAAHFIRMNDLVVQNMVVIPLVWRNWVSGVGNKLKGTDISGWDSSFWNLAHWYREA